jgi:adenylate cyclase class 2
MDGRGLPDLPPAELSWQSLAERANAAVWTVDRDLKITASRGADLRDLNLQQDKLVGKSLFDYLQTRDEAFLPIAMHRRALRGETVTYLYDRKGIVCSVQLSPLRNLAGEVVGVCGVSADVTQQVRGERLLVASQQILEAIARGSPLGEVLELLTRSIGGLAGNRPCAVLLLDPLADVLRVGAVFGIDPTLRSVLDGLPVGSQNGSCAAAVYERARVFVTDIAADSRWALVGGEFLMRGIRSSWSLPLFMSNGLVVGSIGLYGIEPRGPTAHEERLLERARDLAQIAVERDRSEAVRREWESRLSAVLENTSDCVWAVDNQCSLLAYNSAYSDFCSRCGLPRPVQGMPLDDLYDPELDFASHRFWRWVFGRALKGETFDVPHQVNVRDQSLHWMLSVAPIRIGSNVTGATVFARDVTEQHQRELLLRWCAEELSLKTGQDFFVEVVNHLIEVTGMDYAMIGSLQPGLPRRVRSWLPGDRIWPLIRIEVTDGSAADIHPRPARHGCSGIAMGRCGRHDVSRAVQGTALRMPVRVVHRGVEREAIDRPRQNPHRRPADGDEFLGKLCLEDRLVGRPRDRAVHLGTTGRDRSRFSSRLDMTYEVELKFPLADNIPVDEVLSRLVACGAEAGSPVEQRDLYFGHPARDFAQTDEAFRLRRIGERNLVTYKGPVIDTQTKMRRELELTLPDGESSFEGLREMLVLLGFSPVREVRKTRVPFHIAIDGRDLEATLDDVAGLGFFVEIETLADEATRDAARDSILRFARTLGLSNPERRSYLCLLLEQDQR